MVHGHRGGVIGAVVTTAIIVATSSPQFLGAMVMGPLAAWIMKQVDDRVQDSMYLRDLRCYMTTSLLVF